MVVRFLLIFVFSSAGFSAAQAKRLSPVEGIVYLRDGSQVEFREEDRIRIPKKRSAITAYRGVFQYNTKKQTFDFDRVDSLVCWHARSPEHRRKFLPVPSVGWCWVYFETPYIRSIIYQKKGYALSSNGGIHLALGAYYLQKTAPGMPLCSLGRVKYYHRGLKFRQRIARYIQDDPDSSREVEQSIGFRDATLFLIKRYVPADKHDH